MKDKIEFCRLCGENTNQNVVVESWLDFSGTIIIYYWRRCNKCGEINFQKTKELYPEEL